MNFVPLIVLWIVLAVVVLVLFIWRKAVAAHEDDNIHVLDGDSGEKTVEQVAIAKKLDLIDKWGKIATVVVLVYAVILGGLYAWQSWVQNTRIGA
jgi:Na+/H+ antiporter NhaC